jgi:hypothetical protein
MYLSNNNTLLLQIKFKEISSTQTLSVLFVFIVIHLKIRKKKKRRNRKERQKQNNNATASHTTRRSERTHLRHLLRLFEKSPTNYFLLTLSLFLSPTELNSLNSLTFLCLMSLFILQFRASVSLPPSSSSSPPPPF